MSSRQSLLRIGEVAASSGLSVDALRYYERVGLLQRQARTAGGFRAYGPDTIERLSFIRQAQMLGLRLKDVRELLSATGHPGRRGCEEVRSLLISRLTDVEKQLTELKAFRRTLRAALEHCDSALTAASVVECPVVQSLTPHSRNGKVRR
jgi:DNA-binding transcriptional MerR regulator